MRLVVLVLKDKHELPCYLEDFLTELLDQAIQQLSGPVPPLWEPEELLQTIQDALMNEED